MSPLMDNIDLLNNSKLKVRFGEIRVTELEGLGSGGGDILPNFDNEHDSDSSDVEDDERSHGVTEVEKMSQITSLEDVQ